MERVIIKPRDVLNVLEVPSCISGLEAQDGDISVGCIDPNEMNVLIWSTEKKHVSVSTAPGNVTR